MFSKAARAFLCKWLKELKCMYRTLLSHERATLDVAILRNLFHSHDSSNRECKAGGIRSTRYAKRCLQGANNVPHISSKPVLHTTVSASLQGSATL